MCVCGLTPWVLLDSLQPYGLHGQASLFMGFSRNEYWCELPLSPPGHPPDPRINLPSLMSSALAGGLFTSTAFWQALILMFKFVDLINLYVCVCIHTHTHIYIQGCICLSIQFKFSRSVVSDSLHPMDCSMAGPHVHNQLLEFTQAHVHWVVDAIQSSHPLSSPSSPDLNLSELQGFLKWVSSLH